LGRRRLLLSSPCYGARSVDQYFDEITVEKVKEPLRGWERIRGKPLLWQQQQ